jgi:hypothetical protein
LAKKSSIEELIGGSSVYLRNDLFVDSDEDIFEKY